MNNTLSYIDSKPLNHLTKSTIVNLHRAMKSIECYGAENIEAAYKSIITKERKPKILRISGYISSDKLQVLVELMKSETLPKHLQVSLELWLFMAYSGLRYCDLIRLQHENIGKDTIDIYLKFSRIKPYIDILPVLRWILDKHLKNNSANLNNYVLPYKSKVLLNRDIKKILSTTNDEETASLIRKPRLKFENHSIDLNESITVNSGRKSFINLAISNGVRIDQLAVMLGCDIRNLKKYYKPNREELKRIAFKFQ